MVTKELVVAAIGLIMGIVNTFVGHQIFSSDQISQIAEILFLAITFVAAYLHQKPQQQQVPTPPEKPSVKNSIQLP